MVYSKEMFQIREHASIEILEELWKECRRESEVHDDEKIKAREKDETYQHT
jgi:hypothetical protein